MMNAAIESAAVEAEEAGDANGASSALLRVLVPLLWRRLNQAGRRHLWACCREARRIASRTVEALSLEKSEWEPAECADAVAGLRGMLERRCRPRSLNLTFRKGPERWPEPETSAFRLRVLAELRAVFPPPLVALSLTGLPLTEEVVRAITEAAPLLVSLSLQHYDLSHDTAHPDSTPSTPAVSGVQGLLHLTAPHLQRLSLSLAGPAGSPAPADGLGPLLLRCSRLEALSLRWCCSKVPVASSRVLGGVLAQLPALRSLELVLPEDDEAGAEAGSLVLTCLPQLTRLVVLRGNGVLRLGSVLPAVAQMRGLADLRLLRHKLRPAHLLQLAALTALTRLHIGGVWATDELVHNGGQAAGYGLRAAGAPPLVPLPAQLRVLVLSSLATASEIAALELRPRLQLQLEGITMKGEDKDADGRLRSLAAESLLAACRQLVGRLCKCDNDLGPELDPAGAPQPFTITVPSAAAPASWPDLYGTLFAALQPVMLRHLTINEALLTVLDVGVLVRHLPLLEDLGLHCAVELPSLPLLLRLKRLRCLHLYPEEKDLEEGWDSELALRAALLVLCAESHSLTEVNLWFLPDPDPDDPLVAAAYAAADWLTEELPSLRGDPPEVCVIIMDSSDDDEEGGSEDEVSEDEDNEEEGSEEDEVLMTFKPDLAARVKACADAGADIVRITVQGKKEAEACMRIREQLFKDRYDTPLVADIHFQPTVAMMVAEAFEKFAASGQFAATPASPGCSVMWMGLGGLPLRQRAPVRGQHARERRTRPAALLLAPRRPKENLRPVACPPLGLHLPHDALVAAA
ncbi:4-hydroxy-3-methylbut-2-en-1-yl diphosphate synthase, chloroplastic [Tetrabaena socialis]|uniref:4-hydroxy-3-methylbut-2-en-1-yl diphosphate synthase, chloroplastic n=1 Tax=Tetrabaena socialis TaxID=47790 RepID=A0A2J8AAR9_9CHLO|nr:4-hydroxy-3-methylbut-2-en-1-yl diphosphate synthase, chloroplastic [Tetrabaena socialis]|eukprot:PNH09629.1 4-hydroxy-3-methylbut-2-en-1-yl diphosphate synthase, chloroplastic [Tetrabaena socialis]